MKTQVVIYAKNPMTGTVKTRLAKDANARLARNAYARLLEQCVAELAGINSPVNSQNNRITTTLACSPNTRHGSIRTLCNRYKLKRQLQPQGDLGRRMAASIRKGLAQHDAVIIVGTDCPTLDASKITDAIAALAHNNTYAQAAQDGGYVLIASAQYCPKLFRQIDWSTPKVLAQTRRQARSGQQTLTVGPALSDIDHYQDWRHARQQKQVAPLWRGRLRKQQEHK